MAEPISDAEASRISNHMNADHSSSLSHYLEHFASIKNASAPKITSFTTPSMTLEYGPETARKQWIYDFVPPMMAGQARKRLESMHTEARKGLGYSEFTISTFTLSRTTTFFFFLFLWIPAAVLVTPSTVLASYTPALAGLTSSILSYFGRNNSLEAIGNAQKLYFVGTLWAFHLGEALFLLSPLLRRFNVEDRKVRAKYFLATIIAGAPVWRGLRLTGEEGEKEIEAKKAVGKGH